MLFVVLGLLGDARPAAARAQRRLAVTRPTPHTPSERADYAMAWLRAFLDESAPGRTRAHRAAAVRALADRSRPARRGRAGRPPRPGRGGARRVGRAAGRLAARRPPRGRCPGRVGARDPVRVRRDRAGARMARGAGRRALDGASDDERGGRGPRPGPGSPRWRWPPPRSAWPASPWTTSSATHRGRRRRVQIRVGPDRVRLVIADDGPGLPAEIERTAATAGHRGLADMVAEASGSDASLQVDRGGGAADGPGTTVTFDWPAAPARAR